jgi:hypothetical protein
MMTWQSLMNATMNKLNYAPLVSDVFAVLDIYIYVYIHFCFFDSLSRAVSPVALIISSLDLNNKCVHILNQIIRHTLTLFLFSFCFLFLVGFIFCWILLSPLCYFAGYLFAEFRMITWGSIRERRQKPVQASLRDDFIKKDEFYK